MCTYVFFFVEFIIFFAWHIVYDTLWQVLRTIQLQIDGVGLRVWLFNVERVSGENRGEKKTKKTIMRKDKLKFRILNKSLRILKNKSVS